MTALFIQVLFDNRTEDPQIIINDTSIIEEMNTAQINNNETNEEAIENNHEWRTVANNNRYNLRPRPANRGNMYTLLQNGQKSTRVAIPKPHAHVMLTQMNVREGIKRFGEKGNEALLKELNQLHQWETLLPVSREDMSYDEQKKALRYLMFLKEKHDGSIKARGCADGRSQMDYMTKNETSSLTISQEAMMLSCEIDPKEGRHVAVTDIPGEFLHADVDQHVHMLLEGMIAELIVKLEPRLYRKYIWKNKNDKPMLYVKLREALYGALQAALLFWKLLSYTLKEVGFKINDDWCVSKITINGKLCTIILHMDDLKISHIKNML